MAPNLPNNSNFPAVHTARSSALRPTYQREGGFQIGIRIAQLGRSVIISIGGRIEAGI